MPEELLNQGFSIGIVVSLIFHEVLGITAGGIIVPGYLAFQTSQPLGLAGTMAIALMTYGFIRLLSNFMFIYGTRRLVITLLAALIIDELVFRVLDPRLRLAPLGFVSIGRIVPGLIAGWMDTQGIIYTVSGLIVVIVIVSFILILVQGSIMLPVAPVWQ